MTRQHRYDDENFETVTGPDGKPMRVLKDGRRVRVSMQMRDASMARSGVGSHQPLGQRAGDVCMTNDKREGRLRMVNGELQCVANQSDAAKPQFFDGRTTDPTALNRPGFRVPVVNDRRAVHDAYDRYNTGLVNAYKLHDGQMQCASCFGSGQGPDGDDCSACNGTGVMPDASAGGSRFGSNNGDDEPDPASDSRTVDARATEYQRYDAEISQAWRKG